MTGEKFTGEIAAIYNQQEVLVQVDMAATNLSPQQRRILLSGMPCTVAEIPTCFSGKITVVEAAFEVTFEMFWQRFGLKRNKLHAEKLWEKLRKTEQVEAWHRIEAYDKYCKKNAHWYQRMYPDTWLRGRQWESEWETL
jgi:hypothetical protein